MSSIQATKLRKNTRTLYCEKGFLVRSDLAVSIPHIPHAEWASAWLGNAHLGDNRAPGTQHPDCRDSEQTQTHPVSQLLKFLSFRRIQTAEFHSPKCKYSNPSHFQARRDRNRCFSRGLHTGSRPPPTAACGGRNVTNRSALHFCRTISFVQRYLQWVLWLSIRFANYRFKISGSINTQTGWCCFLQL